MQGGVIPTARSYLRLARARWGPPYGLRAITLTCVFSALTCAFSPSALAASTFATADTYLKSGQPNKNQGTETLLRIQQSGPNHAPVLGQGG